MKTQVYDQASTDEEIEDWAKNIILGERDIELTGAEVFYLLNESGLIHLARQWGAGDTDIGDQILCFFDKTKH